jgi:hypothetical protein
MTKAALSLFCVSCLLAAVLTRTPQVTADSAAVSNQPVYSSDGHLRLPANYREWIFLSSGLGMNYSAGEVKSPAFTNVFVAPEAYRTFMKTAKWPDKSMFVVEIYSATSHGSINKGGQFQQNLLGLDVEVKDASRPAEWSYYNFDPGAKSASAIGTGCAKCHADNAAVEHTFVQFYPTLLEFAKGRGIVKPTVSLP